MTITNANQSELRIELKNNFRAKQGETQAICSEMYNFEVVPIGGQHYFKLNNSLSEKNQ